MDKLSEKLVKLGYAYPDLRPNLRPILDKLSHKMSPEAAHRHIEYTLKNNLIALDSGRGRYIDIYKSGGGIEGTYRSHHDEYDYEALEDECVHTEKLLKENLSAVSDHIRSISVEVGDKNYLEVYIDLK